MLLGVRGEPGAVHRALFLPVQLNALRLHWHQSFRESESLLATRESLKVSDFLDLVLIQISCEGEVREHMNPLFPQVWRHFPLGSPGYILEQENFYSSITFLLPSWATTCIAVTLQEQCFQAQRRKTRLLPSSNANTGWVVWACLFSFLLEFFWDQPHGYNLSSKVSSSWRTLPNYSVKAQGSRIGKVGKKRYRTIKWPSNRNRNRHPACTWPLPTSEHPFGLEKSCLFSS